MKAGNGLFNSDGKMFWSASLLRRMETYEKIKEKRTQAANARWNKESNAKKNAKICKSIKGICKSNALAYKKRYKCNANIKKLYAKKCKLNQIKLNEIKLNNIDKSILSIIKTDLIDKMDGSEQKELAQIIKKSEVNCYGPGLREELMNVIYELYKDVTIRPKLKNLNIRHIDNALKNYAIANTKSDIRKPKSYFKECILSSLNELNISQQYDVETSYRLNDF